MRKVVVMHRDKCRCVSCGLLNEYCYELEVELKAHKENEGDECPLCVLEDENKRLKMLVASDYGKDGE